MIRDAIKKVVEGLNLSEDEAAFCMQEIMSGEATPSQVASLITALRMKGETVEEITGFAKVMRKMSIKIPTKHNPSSMIDTCGTGGDHSNTFNISTAAAFIVAGAGVPVAKHGNRAMSSKCGSADVLEALGVDITLSAEAVGQCLDEVGIGFMFAPSHHPSMKHAIIPRKEIGIRTAFNILGPLTNPADAKKQLLGVSEARLTELMAAALLRLGSNRAIVAHGLDGIDELTTVKKTQITEIKDGGLATYQISPEEMGIPAALKDDIEISGGAEESARVITSILNGEQGPRRNIVLLNAGAALYVAEKASTLKGGIAKAAETIDNGQARDVLNGLVKLSQRLGESDIR